MRGTTKSSFEKSSEPVVPAGKTLDPGRPGQIRRTRGSASKKKSNGQAGNGARSAVEKANGLDPAPFSSAAQNAFTASGRAASDDASGASVATAATPSAAACADRDACAEVAHGRNGAEPGFSLAGTNPELEKRVSPADGAGPPATPDASTPRVPSENKEQEPGDEPLPLDPAEFVDEIHRRIDLIEVWVGLLKSEDEKIKQRAAERLTDLMYKNAATYVEEQQQILFDIDSAAARRAAEGAKK